VINQTPLLLGLVNYFERHLPYVGYFAPIGGTAAVDTDHPVDQHLRLIHDVFDLKHDVRQMVGLPEDEATRMIAAGKTADMLDRIYASFAAYKSMHDVVIVQGSGVGTEEVEAQLAASLSCPAIITGRMGRHLGVADLHTQLVLKRQSLVDHKASRGCLMVLSTHHCGSGAPTAAPTIRAISVNYQGSTVCEGEYCTVFLFLCIRTDPAVAFVRPVCAWVLGGSRSGSPNLAGAG
jgi:hypothetical protein